MMDFGWGFGGMFLGGLPMMLTHGIYWDHR